MIEKLTFKVHEFMISTIQLQLKTTITSRHCLCIFLPGGEMAYHLGATTPRASLVSLHRAAKLNQLPLAFDVRQPMLRTRYWRARVSDGGNSYLDMWKNAVDRGRKAIEFQKIAENTAVVDDRGNGLLGGATVENLEKKSEEFEKILEVSKEERDRIQQMQVIDRAAAAISAARATLKETVAKQEVKSGDSEDPDSMSHEEPTLGRNGRKKEAPQGMQSGSIFVPRSETSGNGTPGPDFWSWTPPTDSDSRIDDFSNLQTARTTPAAFQPQTMPLAEKERTKEVLPLQFESKLGDHSDHNPPLPPLQSLLEIEKLEVSESATETPSLKEELQHTVEFSVHAAEAAEALDEVESLADGVRPDGSRWWKETGIEQRPDGVMCKWTVKRGISADQVVEWQEKYWEASDELGYKELGSEKSGRDATGNVWREYWRESMRQDSGLVHLEKTADKWGKNGNGDEWQEQWWEHYNSSGQADKWAHKWCSIDPTTPLDAGHAHVWHERWGEEYDGKGGSIKYTDKWAERSEDGGWTKWGDKWDENFDPNGHGVKQGETWWEGKYGERWNRTWGEGHNGSGWVHKYGKSSSGEHWDTHEPQETWYERFPHFGFYHCYDHSVQLREVPKPSDM